MKNETITATYEESVDLFYEWNRDADVGVESKTTKHAQTQAKYVIETIKSKRKQVA